MANRRGKCGSSERFPLLGLQNHCRWWLQPWNEKMIGSWQESYDKPRLCIEKQRYFSANQGLCSQGYGLPSGHIWLWELNCKEGRMPKWCWRRVMRVPWIARRSNQLILRVNGTLVGRTDVKAEVPVFWSPNAKSWLIGKVPDAGKDWEQKKRASEH